jgi:hypothetical protein
MTSWGVCCLASVLSGCGGGNGSGPGPPTNDSSISAPAPQAASTNTTSAASSVEISGTIAGTDGQEFTLQSGYPHGFVRIHTTTSTTIVGPSPYVGEHVEVTGTGSASTDAGIVATKVALLGATSPPTTTPSTAPPASSTAPLMASSAGKIGLFQVFDQFNTNEISAGQARDDARRYGLVWGDRIGMPAYWSAGNPAIVNTYYVPQEDDADWDCCDGSGGIGHTLSWWQTYHPSWVLYACTADGTPTRLPAFISGLQTNVPLDIHNPDVVDYQVHLAGDYAIEQNFQGLAYDEVLFYNVTGNAINSTDYGCGIYDGGEFVRRYSGKTDPRWTADTVAWIEAARDILRTDPTFVEHHLKLVVNHPAESVSNADEQTILRNVDGVVDETGFSDYGNYRREYSLFQTTAEWMTYAQAHGASPLIIDKFEQTSAITRQQLEYSIATYLMGHDGSSGLFVGNANAYGLENYHSEYTTAVGIPCGAYYESTSAPEIWFRRFTGVLVVVNSGSLSAASALASLPTNHTYRDLEGQTVTNPLRVDSSTGYVLLTTDGCR